MQFLDYLNSFTGPWMKVKMFRCVADPMVGSKPRNAFMLPDLPDWEAYKNMNNGEIWIKTDKSRVHVIPVGNLSSVEMEYAQEPAPKTIQEAAIRRKHLRPTPTPPEAS